MGKPPKNPTNWDDYQYGTSHRGSISTVGSTTGRSVRFSEDNDDESVSPSALDNDESRDQLGPVLKHRRYVFMRVHAHC